MTFYSDHMTDEEFVSLAAEFKVSNLDKSLVFYKEILDFEVYRIDKKNKHATLKFNGAFLMIKEDMRLTSGKERSDFFVRFIVSNLENYYDKVKSKGARILFPLEKMSYGVKRFYVQDLDKYQLKFCEKL